ncbi:MAG: tRNA dihydrouridine synthase DusB [Planctomycetales bacterium]
MEYVSYPPPPPREPLSYGSLRLESRYLLSPLAGFTNLPFRRIIRQIGGVGLCTTDLVNARGLLEGSRKTRELIETCPEDVPLSVQIFGAEPEVMRDAAQFLEARGTQSIDINMGCPVDRITKGGAGASMMCERDRTVELVRKVVEGVKIPVTVKMRLGWDSRTITAPAFARAFEDVGVAAVAIHGRTREQGFSGTVDRSGIRAVVEAVQRIPVIGNGDIRNIPDAARMFEETGCHGVSVGRGALANPWIFVQLTEWERTGRYPLLGTFEERLGLLMKQLQYLIELQGMERGVPFFRKMAHWYLRGMYVPGRLRNDFQQARTREELEEIVQRIAERGPTRGSRTGMLPDLHIPVPSGPVEHW